MKNEFVFENTIEFFFYKFSSRVKNKIKQRNIPLKAIYPSDEKLISHIQNNKRYANTNRYLLTDTVIGDCGKHKDTNIKTGLVPVLFDKNTQALLWGTDEEIIQNLPTIFYRIIKDLSEMPQKYDIDLDLILSDYAPYAFNWTYYQLLSKNNVAPTDYSYGVIPANILFDLPCSRKKATIFLYQKCKENFKEKFLEFADKTKSYLKIDKVFEKNFIVAEFIPLLKNYIPMEDSIGLRVRHLIMTDISKSSNLIAQQSTPNAYTELNRTLVHLSSQYVCDLIKLQEKYLSLFAEKYSR